MRTLVKAIHQMIADSGLDNVFMLDAPEMDECTAVIPYASTPYSDIPISDESFQIASRAKTYEAVMSRSWRALNALTPDVLPAHMRSGVQYVLSLRPIQTPTYLGKDGSGRHEAVFNIDVTASWAEKGRI
jgi:hypothetical protein